MLNEIIARRVDDLLGVTDDGQVRVVRDHDDLPALLRALDASRQHLVDRLVAEVLLRSVDDHGNVVLVDQKDVIVSP